MTQRKTAPLSLLLIAYAVFFVMALPTGILNVAWSSMQETYSLRLDALGVLLFANTCGSLLGTFFSGRLIGRFGVGTFLTAGGAVMSLGLLGYVVAPSWVALIAAAFVTTLGFSCFNTGLNLFVSARYTAGQFNWLHASYGLGQTVGPALATLIVEQLGQSWHLGYLIVALLVLPVTALLLFTRQQWTMTGVIPSGARISLRESLRVPVVLLGMATFFASSGYIASTGQLSDTLLTSRGVEQAGFWVSFYWGSFTIGRFIMGFIAQRLDNTKLIRASILGAGVGALLLWQSASAPLNLLGLAIIGFASAPMYPTLIAETHRRIESRHRANAIGFQIAGGVLGTSLVPGAMAWLAEHTSVSLIGGFLVVGVLLVLALHEITVRRREAVSVPVSV